MQPPTVDALRDRVTRLSVRKQREEEAARAQHEGMWVGGKRDVGVGGANAGFERLIEDSAYALDVNELFSVNSMEGSLRGGNSMMESSHGRRDSFEGELKFTSALPSVEDLASGEWVRGSENGRRPPTPGKQRDWLTGDVDDSSSAMQVDDKSPPNEGRRRLRSGENRGAVGVLASPKRNGSMSFVRHGSHGDDRSLVTSPTAVKPRARRLELDGSPNLANSPCDMFGENVPENASSGPFSRTSSTLSTISLPSAFSPVSQTMSRNVSQGELAE